MRSHTGFTGYNAWLTVMIALLVLIATACGSSTPADTTPAAEPSPNSQPPSTAAGEAPAKEIQLNIGTLKIAALTNLYAAEKLGYFKEEGLKVTFTQMGGGAELLPAVSAGKIDITLSIPSSAIQARDKGFDFQMIMQNEIAAKEGRDTQAVFVNADSGIASMKDFEGKRVAVNNIGSQMWLSFVEVLEQNGADKNAVNFIELPFPNMEDALVNKQVDAVFNVEPFTSKMLSNPALSAISYAATESLPGQPIGAFWASEKWLASNGETVEKYVNAMNKANVYLAEHPKETQDLIAEYTGLPLEAIQGMNPINWSTKVDEKTIQALLDLMKKHSLIESDMTVEEIVFPSALN